MDFFAASFKNVLGGANPDEAVMHAGADPPCAWCLVILIFESILRKQNGGGSSSDFFAKMSDVDKQKYEEAKVGLSEQQLQRLQEIFSVHDADGSGEIDVGLPLLVVHNSENAHRHTRQHTCLRLFGWASTGVLWQAKMLAELPTCNLSADMQGACC